MIGSKRVRSPSPDTGHSDTESHWRKHRRLSAVLANSSEKKHDSLQHPSSSGLSTHNQVKDSSSKASASREIQVSTPLYTHESQSQASIRKQKKSSAPDPIEISFGNTFRADIMRMKQQILMNDEPKADIPVPNLGPAISLPTSLLSPFEWANEDAVDPEFGEKVCTAYKVSLYGDSLRRKKYGEAIADAWKYGFTPQEARLEWICKLEAQLEIYENISTSEDSSDSEAGAEVVGDQ